MTGKPDVPGQPNVAQMKTMIQKLLADRFQLKFHREKKELSVYAITIGKAGKKFAKGERDPDKAYQDCFSEDREQTWLSRTRQSLEFASVVQGAVLDRPVIGSEQDSPKNTISP